MRQRVLTDTDEPRARHWRFLTDLEDVFVNPAHTDVRFGQDHNDVEPPLGFGIPEFRFQPDETGGTISIRVGATGMPATALCDQRAEPLVVPQANRASNVGCSVCGDPDGETEVERRVGNSTLFGHAIWKSKKRPNRVHPGGVRCRRARRARQPVRAGRRRPGA